VSDEVAIDSPDDVNTIDDADDINTLDDGAGDINRIDDNGAFEDDGDDEGNRVAGGTPLAVVTYLVNSITSEPESVVIETEERRGSVRFSIHVAPDDMGRVIGRRGRVAQAIRTVVAAAGARDGVQTSVDIVDD
jgi:uncharacterized protein